METQATAYFQAHSGASIGKKTDAYLSAKAALPDRDRSQQRGYRPNKSANEGKKPWERRRNESRESGASGKRLRYCFKCYNTGHLRRDCPYDDATAKKCKEALKNIVEPQGQAAQPLDDTSSEDSDSDSDDADNCLHSSLAIDPSSSSGLTRHIHAGIIRDNNTIETVQVLRDTGSVVHGINRKLVKRHQLTGKRQKVISFGGKCHEYPLARVEVITPMLKGTILACVMKDVSPSFDLLIGNGGVLNFVAPKDDRGHGGTLRDLSGNQRMTRTGKECSQIGYKCYACGH